MAKYRKKPVVIEAFQLGIDRTEQWAKDSPAFVELGENEGETISASIQTLEGVLHASFGDWIIKGVKGELYPCKPDIFAATYEDAE